MSISVEIVLLHRENKVKIAGMLFHFNQTGPTALVTRNQCSFDGKTRRFDLVEAVMTDFESKTLQKS